MKQIEAFLEWGGVKKDVICLVVSGVALLLSMLHLPGLPFDPAWVAIVLCGVPIVLEAVVGLVTAFDIKADVLISMALIASVIIGEHFAAGEVAFIMQLGALLEDLTVERARAGTMKLIRLTPRTARRLTGEKEEVIPAQEVQVGDWLRVLPGETVPVDGRILQGNTSIDQSVMTGESLPVDKQPGDEVSSGTVNQFGAFEMEATRVGEDSSLQRMIRLVQSADAHKAKIVRMADRWATWIVVIALTAAVLAWMVTGEIIRSVTVLVVFCPCALVLATPTAIVAAMGNATRHGFLVREGDALERLAAVKVFAFDKTGTLTRGCLQVKAVESVQAEMAPEEVFACAAAAEGLSEHPLGKAVVAAYRERQGQNPPGEEAFQMLPSRGVSCRVEGHPVLAGNERLLEEAGMVLGESLLQKAEAYRSQGCTVMYIARDGQPVGLLALADTLREDAAETVKGLRQVDVLPVLLTGDHPQAAQSIAKQLGIGEVYAECRPEDKLSYIEQSQQQGKMVCMLGDGVNDAPALKMAQVGIAMGGIGSDIAVEAADVALVNDEIRELPHLLALSRRMMRTIRWNLVFSMTLNFVAIVLALRGTLNPVVGALVHNAGSVLVIANSAWLLKWRKT
ncbi:MAG: heavy metal translocating P-type ATPase [Eubacteriales bacterium]|jgi:heavy metal translocating P-type ATPase